MGDVDQSANGKLKGFQHRAGELETKGVRSTLSQAEEEELEQHEETIRKGMATFMNVGTALKEIREKRLYRAHYSSFEEYCESRWQFKRAYGARVIQAAKVVRRLREEGRFNRYPANEFQARALIGLSDKELLDVWERLETESLDTPLTGEKIKERVKRYRIGNGAERTDRKPKKPSYEFAAPETLREAEKRFRDIEGKLKALTKESYLSGNEIASIQKELGATRQAMRKLLEQEKGTR